MKKEQMEMQAYKLHTVRHQDLLLKMSWPGMFCHLCLVKHHPISTCNTTSSEKPFGVMEGGWKGSLSFSPKC